MTVQEAAEICLQFRAERNVDECICTYLAKVLDVMEAKQKPHDPFPRLPEGHPQLGYEPTKTRKIWRF